MGLPSGESSFVILTAQRPKRAFSSAYRASSPGPSNAESASTWPSGSNSGPRPRLLVWSDPPARRKQRDLQVPGQVGLVPHTSASPHHLHFCPGSSIARSDVEPA